MTPEQFCYWLQGRAELMPETPPSEAEWKMIGEHLATVFKKVTPPKQEVARALGPIPSMPPQDYSPFNPSRLGQCVKSPKLDGLQVQC